MFLQQKLTPNPGMDKNQEKIMLMMPVIFGLMMLSLPAGMVLYMITNTIVSIIQQQWLNRKLAKQFG
jgi:YidC/Oxa1 family membrane protein insertase